MRFIWVLIILQAANAANNDTTTKEYLDLSKAEDNVFLWKNLFIKLNTVLSETEKLGQGLGDVNKRLDDLNKRQTDHENRLTKLMENVLESRVESMKRQQDQENQLSKLMENVNEIREDAKRRQEDQEKLQTQLMANVNASRVDANLRLQKLILKQEDQENRQTKLLENIVEIRADAKKLQEAQEKRQTQLMANVNASRVDNNISQWTTILRRQDGSVNFNRKWDEYKNGFGNPNADFFIGLELLHAMTTNGLAQELLIILIDFENETRYARYDLFRIGSEADKYAIKELGTYSGDAGDGMGWHRGKKFSTFDKDNNAGKKRDCPQSFKGGWWFHDPCYSGHLNGPYRLQKDSKTWGVSWHPWREWNVSMKYAAMMIRPKL